MSNITPGTWARVRLRADCPGDSRRAHHPAGENCRVKVTAIAKGGAHCVFALYNGGGCDVSPPPGGLGIGRHFRPDELEPIPEPCWSLGAAVRLTDAGCRTPVMVDDIEGV